MKRWQVVVLVIVVALGLAGVGVARFLMPYTLEDEMRFARAHGVATTADECFPPIPPGQDARPDYDRARKLNNGVWADRLDIARQSLAAPGGPTRAELAKLRVAFAHNQGYFAAIHAAASKPACDFRSSTAEGSLIAFGQMANLREAATAVHDEASFQMYDGRPVEAAKTLRLGMNVASHAYSHPTLIGALCGVAIDSIMDAGYKQLLLRDGGNPEVCRAVRDSLRTDLSPPDISHALAGEAAVMPSLLEDVPSGARIGAKAISAAHIHWTARETIASRVPRDQQRAAIRGVIDDYARSSHLNPLLRESGAGLANTPKVMDILDTQAARRSTIYAAACVLDYRARRGRYPVRLADAVKPVPADPFSQAPLSYKRTVNGFELVFTEASRRAGAKARTRMRFAYPGPKPPAPGSRPTPISTPGPPPPPAGPPMSGTP